MFRRLSKSQNVLYEFIDTLLWEEWDPIGVNDDSDWPRDEYQSYAMPLFNMVLRGADIKEVAHQLSQVEQAMFGLTPDESANQIIAERIIAEAKKLVLA